MFEDDVRITNWKNT